MKKNKKRFNFSHDFKRDALVLYTSGMNSNEVFEKLGFDILKIEKNDKKYTSKLINKWKNEAYSNKKILYFASCKLEEKRILSEIEEIEKYSKNAFGKGILDEIEKCKNFYMPNPM